MRYYWTTFTDHASGTITASSPAEAENIATTFGQKKSLDVIPYPASPKLNEDNSKHPCPCFCFSPERCKGYTSCPRSYACSE